MTASIGPTVRRRRLGTELRRLREANSIKLEEVAEQLGVAPSTLSRIETGKAPTRSAYLSEMLETYGVEDPGQRQVLVDMAREGHRKGWWAAYEDVLPTGFGIYVGLEAEAASLRAFESLVVHGLLQTDGLRPGGPGPSAPEAVRRGDRPAGDRADAAAGGPATTRSDPLRAVADPRRGGHAAVHGPPEVMREQLDHLADGSTWPNVTLQVLPFTSGAAPVAERPVHHHRVPRALRPRCGVLRKRRR